MKKRLSNRAWLAKKREVVKQAQQARKNKARQHRAARAEEDTAVADETENQQAHAVAAASVAPAAPDPVQAVAVETAAAAAPAEQQAGLEAAVNTRAATEQAPDLHGLLRRVLLELSGSERRSLCAKLADVDDSALQGFAELLAASGVTAAGTAPAAAP